MVFLYTLLRFGRCERCDSSADLTWQHWPAADSTAKLTLSYTPDGRITISENGSALEMFDICYGAGRHRLFYRDATVLFLLAGGDESDDSRKMRVLFESDKDCEHFRKHVAKHLDVVPMCEAMPPPDPPPVLKVTPPAEEEEEEERRESVRLSTSAVEGLVRLCLLDPCFPALVSAVERNLAALIQETPEIESND